MYFSFIFALCHSTNPFKLNFTNLAKSKQVLALWESQFGLILLSVVVICSILRFLLRIAVVHQNIKTQNGKYNSIFKKSCKLVFTTSTTFLFSAKKGNVDCDYIRCKKICQTLQIIIR